MTKRRLHVLLTPEADRLLARAVRDGGATRTAIVDAAIRELLDKSSEERELSRLSARLNKLMRAMERLADDATAQTESLALFILDYLCVTPPLPETQRAGAEALGRLRFDHFISQVSARLLGKERYADALLAKIDLVRGSPDNEPGEDCAGSAGALEAAGDDPAVHAEAAA